MNSSIDSSTMRRQFLSHLVQGLRVIWPILAVLLVVLISMGCAVALLEGWRLLEGVYFAFVSGLTIGYGDLAPKAPLARVLAISIGLMGIVFSGLIAAVGVQALQQATLKTHQGPHTD